MRTLLMPDRIVIRDVRSALMIPSGMTGVGQFRGRAAGYMQVEPAYERPVVGLGDDPSKLTDSELATIRSVVGKLVAAGMPESEARSRAVQIFVRVRRQHPPRKAQHHDRGLHRGWTQGRHRGWTTGATRGLGDENETGSDEILAKIIADAQEVEAKHKKEIDLMGEYVADPSSPWHTDSFFRAGTTNRLAALRDEFVRRSLPTLGVQFPYQLNRTDPAAAVVLAVRDDISETISLIDQMKWQQVIAKEVREIRAGQLRIEVPKVTIPKVPSAAVAAAVVLAALGVGKATGVI